jgi:hypothetical protein
VSPVRNLRSLVRSATVRVRVGFGPPPVGVGQILRVHLPHDDDGDQGDEND